MLRAPKVEPPSDDKRWRIVQGTMRRNGFSRHALIETLHTVQESFGFIDNDSMHFVAESLHVPLSRVYGVSTFYHLFSLKPAGDQVEAIKRKLNEEDVRHEVAVYKGAGHGWFCDQRADHREDAAADAWDKVRALFVREAKVQFSG